jgi:apolipoprotein D and lipocalin family protein
MRRLALLLPLLAACSTTTTTERERLPPVQTVPAVELSSYLGTWYEIASFPQSFQEGCAGTTATYRSRDDGEIDVENRCRDGSLTGDERTANGRARVVDRTTNARLEVSFFRPFWGDYWVIDLDPAYGWAVVGHPSRDYLWILSRTPSLPPPTMDAILGRLKAQGFPLERLRKTEQPAG